MNEMELMALAIVIDWLKTVGLAGAAMFALSLILSLRGE